MKNWAILFAMCAVAFATSGEVVFDSGKPRSFEAGQSKGWKVKLDPEWAVLTVKTRVKPTDVVVGKDNWMNARVPMSFHDADGKVAGRTSLASRELTTG